MQETLEEDLPIEFQENHCHKACRQPHKDQCQQGLCWCATKMCWAQSWSFIFLFSQKDFLCLQGEFTCMCARYRHGMWNCEFRNFSNAPSAVPRSDPKCPWFTRHESSATQDPSNLKVNIVYLVSVFRSLVVKKQHAKWFYLDTWYTWNNLSCNMSNRFIRNKSR